MKYTIKAIIAAISFLFFSNILLAQHNTNSPYSMFGIGEIDNHSYGLNSGMANTGIGLQLTNFMNTSNPASLCSIDTLTFIFDVASSAKFSKFTYGKKSDNVTEMNLKKIALGFRITPKLALSVGLRPYSNMGYKMITESFIEGTSQKFNTEFEGSGGLNRLYLTNSYKLTPNLSIGVNTSLLFGTIDQTETQTEFLIEKSAFTRNFYFDFGAQYSNKINSNLLYTVGAIYGYKSNISLSNNVTIYDIISSSTKNILDEYTEKATKTAIPQFFGTGASLTSIKGSSVFIFAADYLFENWGAINNPTPTVKYINSHKINAGAQYLPNFRLPKNYLQRIQYQIGGSYNLSHMKIEGHRLKEYSLSVGMNLPINRSYVYLAANFGYRTGKNLISERFITFTLGCSFTEFWFFKRFYD